MASTFFINQIKQPVSAAPPPSNGDWRMHPSPSNPSGATTTKQDGWAVYENATYRIAVGDNDNVVVRNKQSGEEYHLTGAEMKIDGQDGFSANGTTTYSLHDGTKLTIENTRGSVPDPSVAEYAPYLPSKITITNGNYGVQITGADSKATGDLNIHEYKGQGRTLDATVGDGNVLHENPLARGFLGVDQSGQTRTVDRQFMKETDTVQSGKPHDAQRDKFDQQLDRDLGVATPTFVPHKPATAPHHGHAHHHHHATAGGNRAHDTQSAQQPFTGRLGAQDNPHAFAQMMNALQRALAQIHG